MFGPFLTPLEDPGANFGGSTWHRQTILDVSNQNPTKIHRDPAIWSHQSHLRPEMPVYGVLGPFLDPQDHLMAITEGPNGTDRPSWKYPNQIQPISIDIQPFVVSTAAMVLSPSGLEWLKSQNSFLKGPGGKFDSWKLILG